MCVAGGVDEGKMGVMEFTADIDGRIIEGILVDKDAVLRDLVGAGFKKREVEERFLRLGLNMEFLNKCRVSGATPTARQCLSCDEIFASLGPANRLCSRCWRKS
jgi:hypothetical protein